MEVKDLIEKIGIKTGKVNKKVIMMMLEDKETLTEILDAILCFSGYNNDDKKEIERMLVDHPNISATALEMLAKSEAYDVLIKVAKHKKTPSHVLMEMAECEEKSSTLYWIIAYNPNAPLDLRDKLQKPEDPFYGIFDIVNRGYEIFPTEVFEELCEEAMNRH